MKYLIKFLKSLKIIIITYILPYIIIIISALIYNLLGYNNIDYFINNHVIFITITYYIITIIYLYKKNTPIIKQVSIIKYYSLISLGISTSILLNMLIFIIHKPKTALSIPLYINIISSEIIGPIYEKLIFRHIYLNKLKQFNTNTKSIIISSLVFAITHINIYKIFFAFILGFILNITYNKTNNLLVPIIIHISANLIAIFLTNFNIHILLLSIISLLLSININIKEKNI